MAGYGDSYTPDTGAWRGGSTSGSSGFNWAGAGQIAQGLGSVFDFQAGRESAEDLAEKYGEIAVAAQGDAETAASRADPFAQYRPGAAQQLSGILSGEIDFRTDPGYQFRMDEAMRETGRAGAARGFNRSGNVMAALDTRAQGVASTEYNNIINRLTGLAGATPQNAIAGGQTYGNMMGNVYSAQLGATANASQAGGAAGIGGLIGGLGDIASGIGGLL